MKINSIKTFLAVIVVTAIALVLAYKNSTSFQKAADIQAMDVVGSIAMRMMDSEEISGGFHKIPIERRELSDGIYQVTGIANVHLIKTTEGNVLIDTGLVIQATKQLQLLKDVAPEPIHSIILTHSHTDHIGGVKFWLEDNTKVIAHREFLEEQRYLDELEPYLHGRNRALFPWIPEKPQETGLLAYGGVAPDIFIAESNYAFELGGKKFEILSTPGGEGADNISVWLPKEKILFCGDFFGPLWPQFPNIFTMRGEKVRKPIEYIKSLNRLIALEPDMIVTGHHDPVKGRENLRLGMVKMRDAVQYVHDEVIKGMNSGRTVYQLMEEVKLPKELELSQEHGRVSWAVKSIWEYYATWFHFDTPTELYAVPVVDVYRDIAEIAGVDGLVKRAENHIDGDQLLHALHLLEIAEKGFPINKRVSTLKKVILEKLLEQATSGLNNNYEKDYLRYELRKQVESIKSNYR